MTASIHCISKTAPDEQSPDNVPLSISRFAKLMGKSPKTIYDWIDKGKMPAKSVVIIAGHMYVDYAVWRRSLPTIN